MKDARILHAGPRWLAGVACLFISAGSMAADAYPAKPITLVVPYSAGGPTDVVARTLAMRCRRISARAWWWKTAPARAAR